MSIFPERLRVRWETGSLATQFAFAGFLVMLSGMMVLGLWLTQKIERGVTRNTANSTASYMRSFVAPRLQELAHGDRISEHNKKELDVLLDQTELGQRIKSFKIWIRGGRIAYSSREALIGQAFPPTENLRRAWEGEVTAEFDSLEDEEDALEREAGLPLLEMYSPIREPRTGRIIAVAEFYEKAQVLQKNLLRARLQTWAVVAAATLLMFAALFGIVSRGSRTIVRQRAVLERRIEELSELLRQNEALRARVQRASRRTTEINEHYLRRISADLHDGPAQLLSLALLRLDALDEPGHEAAHDHDVDTIRRSLGEAIAEIRNICAGLTLPDIEHLSLDGVIRKAAAAHQRRTSTAVAVDAPPLPAGVPKSLKICAFRFVEEALNNAFRHASGQGQAVAARLQDRQIAIEVSDSGPGMALPSGPHDGVHRLGLPGLQERIESLGGELGVVSVPGEGTRLTMRCGIDAEENHLD